MTKQLESFENLINEEIGKKYKPLLKNDRNYKDNLDYLSSRFDSFFTEKKLWFKAVMDIAETRGTRFYFFMNYYKCDVKLVEIKPTVDQICFVMFGFVKYKDKWNQYSISSNSLYYRWKENIPFVNFPVDSLGDYARDFRLIQMLLPIPEEDGALQLVRYENDKINWIDAGRITWLPSSEKEANRFQKQANDFSIKQADRLER